MSGVISPPLICLQGINKDKFTFHLYMKEIGREDLYPAYVSREDLVTSCCEYSYELWVPYNMGNFSPSCSSVA
jgi:hypothetical protein